MLMRLTPLVVMAGLALSGCQRSGGTDRTGSAGGSGGRGGEQLGVPPGWEVAPRAQYTASQIPGRVTVTARGENPRAGYQTELRQTPIEIFPPQFVLVRKPPEGGAGEVQTPFEVTASFNAGQAVDTVTVHDASGPNPVTVDQARD